MRERSLDRHESTKAAAPGPRTVAVPRWETSNSPTASRTAACSASTPPPVYSIGIDQPLKSASLAPAATWRSWRGEVRGLTESHANAAPLQGPAASVRGAGGQRGPFTTIEPVPPTITATDRPLEKLSADAVVVGVGKGPGGPLPTPGAEAVDRLLGGRLLPALADLGARGAEDEVPRLSSLGQGPFPVVAAVGLGAPDASGAYTPEAVRR